MSIYPDARTLSAEVALEFLINPDEVSSSLDRVFSYLGHPSGAPTVSILLNRGSLALVTQNAHGCMSIKIPCIKIFGGQAYLHRSICPWKLADCLRACKTMETLLLRFQPTALHIFHDNGCFKLRSLTPKYILPDALIAHPKLADRLGWQFLAAIKQSLFFMSDDMASGQHRGGLHISTARGWRGHVNMVSTDGSVFYFLSLKAFFVRRNATFHVSKKQALILADIVDNPKSWKVFFDNKHLVIRSESTTVYFTVNQTAFPKTDAVLSLMPSVGFSIYGKALKTCIKRVLSIQDDIKNVLSIQRAGDTLTVRLDDPRGIEFAEDAIDATGPDGGFLCHIHVSAFAGIVGGFEDTERYTLLLNKERSILFIQHFSKWTTRTFAFAGLRRN